MDLESQVFSEVLSRLETLGLDYFITGSIAKVFYSDPRMTRDMDVVIQLPASDIPKFLSAFNKEYYIDRQMIETAVAKKISFNIIHSKKLVKVDFIPLETSDFEKSKFERKQRVGMFGMTVWVISLEDLVLSKLDWAKESFSEQQLRDVSDLLRYNTSLDRDYLDGWITKLGLKEIYKKAKEIRGA